MRRIPISCFPVYFLVKKLSWFTLQMEIKPESLTTRGQVSDSPSSSFYLCLQIKLLKIHLLLHSRNTICRLPYLALKSTNSPEHFCIFSTFCSQEMACLICVTPRVLRILNTPPHLLYIQSTVINLTTTWRASLKTSYLQYNSNPQVFT